MKNKPFTNNNKRPRAFNPLRLFTPRLSFRRNSPFKKETKLLFIILCILICSYALSFLHRPSHASVFSASLMREQDIREIVEIRFSVPTRAEPVEMGEMTLIKDGARFYLRTANGNYPIRQEIIDRFFSLLGAGRSFLPISARSQDYSDYLIDDGHASRIVCARKDKTILSELFFGMPDASGAGRYVRTRSSVRVFLIDNAFEPFLTVAAPFWLDLQIYAALFRGTSLQGLEYGHHNVIRTEANGAAFRALESFLKKFSCIDVYSAPALQSPHTSQVRLALGDGTELRFSFTPLQSGDYVFFDSRSSNVYLISGYTCAQLLQHIEAITLS